jgi:hypothetical protein
MKIYTVLFADYDQPEIEIATHNEQKAIETFKKDIEKNMLLVWENDEVVLEVFWSTNDRLYAEYKGNKTEEKEELFNRIKLVLKS